MSKSIFFHDHKAMPSIVGLTAILLFCSFGFSSAQEDQLRRYTGIIDINGIQINSSMYYFNISGPTMKTDPLPDATDEEYLAFDQAFVPFPLILEKDWEVFGYQQGDVKKDFLPAAKKGNPIACAVLAVYAANPDDKAFWMIQADRLTHPGWSHGVVFAMKLEPYANLRDVITVNKLLSNYSKNDNIVYKGALLGDCLSLGYIDLSRKSLMSGNRGMMAMLARNQSGEQAIPWGLAGGLRGSGLCWQYVANRFRKGTPPSQPVDIVLFCGAAFAGVKIGEEQPKGGGDEMGLSACRFFYQRFLFPQAGKPRGTTKSQRTGAGLV